MTGISLERKRAQGFNAQVVRPLGPTRSPSPCLFPLWGGFAECAMVIVKLSLSVQLCGMLARVCIDTNDLRVGAY